MKPFPQIPQNVARELAKIPCLTFRWSRSTTRHGACKTLINRLTGEITQITLELSSVTFPHWDPATQREIIIHEAAHALMSYHFDPFEAHSALWFTTARFLGALDPRVSIKSEGQVAHALEVTRHPHLGRCPQGCEIALRAMAKRTYRCRAHREVLTITRRSNGTPLASSSK